MKYTIHILFFILYSQIGISQVFLSDVDPARVVNPGIMDYLQKQIDNNITKFTDIEPSLKPDDDLSGYKRQILDYYIEGNPDFALISYLKNLTGKAWNSRNVRMNLLFSKNTGILYYNNDSLEPLDVGQVVYLNLSFLFGLYNLPMAFELTNIDVNNLTIEFSYIKGNQSEGKQQIKFVNSRRGNTRVEHWSYFKSESFLRDRLLYPYFHKKVTDSFHRNLRKSL